MLYGQERSHVDDEAHFFLDLTSAAAVGGLADLNEAGQDGAGQDEAGQDEVVLVVLATGCWLERGLLGGRLMLQAGCP